MVPFSLMSYTHSNLFLKNVLMIPVIPANIWKLKSARGTLLLLQAKSNQETDVVTHVCHVDIGNRINLK